MKISGANDDRLEDIIQEQYRKRAARKAKDGSIFYAAHYKWVSTADYLSNHDQYSNKRRRKKTKSISSKESTKMGIQALNGKGADEILRSNLEADKNIWATVGMKKDQEEGAISSDEEIRPKGIETTQSRKKACKRRVEGKPYSAGNTTDPNGGKPDFETRKRTVGDRKGRSGGCRAVQAPGPEIFRVQRDHERFDATQAPKVEEAYERSS